MYLEGIIIALIIILVALITYILFGEIGTVISMSVAGLMLAGLMFFTLNSASKKHEQTKIGARDRIPGNTLHFADYPDFKPNLTPAEIFEMGSFGGTYWRPIHSSVTNSDYDDKQYLKHEYLRDISPDKMTRPWDQYSTEINKYKVHVGQTLEEWEKKHWITEYDPYGWVQWYCNFYDGRRTPDDARQIARWVALASDKGRFKGMLLGKIKKKYPDDPEKGYDDYSISPKIRQTLQHWGYLLAPQGHRK